MVNDHPAHSGVDEPEVIDETTASQLRNQAVRDWAARFEEEWLLWKPKNQSVTHWRRNFVQGLAGKVCYEAISAAKSVGMTPSDVDDQLAELDGQLDPLYSRLVSSVYRTYQSDLSKRNGLDFDDLGLLATRLLQENPDILAQYQEQWSIILEDEAQDSTPQQERILSMLAKGHGNWVRVGDPNQSIMGTFTSADPRFFREFIQRDDVEVIDLGEAGRSSPPILDLANRIVGQTLRAAPGSRYPDPAFRNQAIHPTGPGDPQGNPPEEACVIGVTEYTSRGQELQDVVRLAAKDVADRPEESVAILVPYNEDGYQIVSHLSREEVPFVEALKNTQVSRAIGEFYRVLLLFVADPLATLGTDGKPRTGSTTSPARFVDLAEHALPLLFDGDPVPPADIARVISNLGGLEVALFPQVGNTPSPGAAGVAEKRVKALLGQAAAWLEAAYHLPPEQFALTVAEQHLKKSELATAQDVAARLRRWRLYSLENEGETNRSAIVLPDLAFQFAERLTSLNLEDQAGDAPPEVGKVTVSTMHKAKGLEWDSVYLVQTSADQFPYRAEDTRQTMLSKDGYPNAVLRRLFGGTLPTMGTGLVAEENREAIAERLRLLYVGVTRAKRRLHISFGRNVEYRGRQSRTQLAEVLQAVGDVTWPPHMRLVK